MRQYVFSMTKDSTSFSTESNYIPNYIPKLNEFSFIPMSIYIFSNSSLINLNSNLKIREITHQTDCLSDTGENEEHPST